MVMPTIFTERGSEINATFDWYDAGAGIGYKTFYGCVAYDSASQKYLLTTSTAMEGRVTATSASAGGAIAKVIDIDFDLEFSSPLTMANADAYVSIKWSAGSDHLAGYVVATLYHVSTAAAETSLGTVTSPAMTAAAATHYQADFMTIPITAVRSFSIGEKLRLSVELWQGKSSGGISSCSLWHDPANRQTFGDTISSTRLTLNIPWVINN